MNDKRTAELTEKCVIHFRDGMAHFSAIFNQELQTRRTLYTNRPDRLWKEYIRIKRALAAKGLGVRVWHKTQGPSTLRLVKPRIRQAENLAPKKSAVAEEASFVAPSGQNGPQT